MKRLQFLFIFALDSIKSNKPLWTSYVQDSLLCGLMIKKLSQIEALPSENIPANYMVT